MSLFHERWRTAVSLLAAGALGDSDRAATLAHLEACEPCRREHAESVALLELFARDPIHTAEPELPASFLLSRVLARLDAVVAPRPARWGWALGAVALAASLAVVVPAVVSRILPGARGPEAPAVAMGDDALRRLERNMAREQAVRYLNEAQDVLVNMAAQPRDCDRDKARVDVGDEAQRSQELLTRRTLLVEMDQEGLASARPVLEDVERVLREVASLRSCARAGDVERVRRDLEERRLLMKIRLMSRELQG
ncbi:MAG: zf-HC2 domain-containing protein [Vicinamibacteria bacterium]